MKLTKLGKELSEQFEAYKDDDKRAVPVLAMIYNEKEKVFSNHFWNKSQNEGKSLDTHAEMLLLKELEMKKYNPTNIIITLSPCFECFCELYKSNRIKNIYFIFGKTWSFDPNENIIKKIIEDSKGKIKKITFPKGMSKKWFIGINKWGNEIVDHLNRVGENRKRGKLYYDEDNASIFLEPK